MDALPRSGDASIGFVGQLQFAVAGVTQYGGLFVYVTQIVLADGLFLDIEYALLFAVLPFNVH